ncbi:hypothetical protein D3C86_1374590 [compost metagenome]
MAEPNPKDIYNQAEAEVLALLQADPEIVAAFKTFETRLKDTRRYLEDEIPAVAVGALGSFERRTQNGLVEVVVELVLRVFSRGGDRDAVTELVQRLTALVGHKIRLEGWNHAPFQAFAEDVELDPVQFQDAISDGPAAAPASYDVEGYLGFRLAVDIPRPSA